jgi:hypothetical protein
MYGKRVHGLLVVPLALLALGLAPGSGRADFEFFTNNPNGFQARLNQLGITDENLLFNQPGLTTIGNPVQGSTNQTNLIVDIGSNKNLMAIAQGQARVEAAVDTFDQFTIRANDPAVSFRSLAFNVNPGAGQGTGIITLTAFDQSTGSSQTVAVVPPQGLFFFGIVSTNGQVLTRAAATSTVQIDDIRLIRLGGGVGRAGEPPRR